MVTRAQVVAAARARLGTRWLHQGRTKGAGLDCIGLVVDVARELGLVAEIPLPNYSKHPDGQTLREGCDRYMTRIDAAAAGPGDVLIFAFTNEPQHMGIVAEHEGRQTIIHSLMLSRKVVETSLDDNWRERIRGAFRIPGVE
jgi:NlpC/P60 family putative phage cell wall peptidase